MALRSRRCTTTTATAESPGGGGGATAVPLKQHQQQPPPPRAARLRATTCQRSRFSPRGLLAAHRRRRVVRRRLRDNRNGGSVNGSSVNYELLDGETGSCANSGNNNDNGSSSSSNSSGNRGSCDVDVHHRQTTWTPRMMSATEMTTATAPLKEASADDSFQDKTFGYGTSVTPGNNETDEKDLTAKKVIFCMHGQLSGCCTLVKGGTGEDCLPMDFRHNPAHFEDHCHRERNEEIDKKARKKLIIASILCVIFMIMEIVGGVWSNSLAIATDAAHLLTDFASFMISLFSIWVASRPATKKMPFGWYRAEVIGALTSVLLIWVVTGVLFFLAVERIINKDFELDASVMLITSAVGVAVNLIMGLTLHQHGHGGHSHGHDHDHGKGKGKGKKHDHHHHGEHGEHALTEGGKLEKLEVDKCETGDATAVVESAHGKKKVGDRNINVRAAFVHVLGDFIQSMGVFIAALVIYFKPSWSIVDPICTFLFSVLVVLTTVAIIKDVMNVLMEGIPKGFDYSQVENTFTQIDGVVKVHNLRIWALSLDKTALSAHLAIRPGVSPQTILRTATRNIHDKYSFFEMTLQIEEFDEKMESCKQCKPPIQ